MFRPHPNLVFQEAKLNHGDGCNGDVSSCNVHGGDVSSCNVHGSDVSGCNVHGGDDATVMFQL